MQISRVLKLAMASVIGLCGAAAADARKQEPVHWNRISANGQIIGHARGERESDSKQIIDHERVEMRLQRGVDVLTLHMQISEAEELNGAPLWFRVHSNDGGGQSVLEGKHLGDGQWRISHRGPNARGSRKEQWPKDVLLSSAMYRALQRQRGDAGQSIALRTIETSSAQLMEVAAQWLGETSVVLPAGTKQLDHWRLQLKNPAGILEQEVWLDQSAEAHKVSTQALGVNLVAERCSRACAMAKPGELDLMQATSLTAPRALSAEERSARLHYWIEAPSTLQWPDNSTEQRRLPTSIDTPATGATVAQAQKLEIDPKRAMPEQPSLASAEHLAANPWVESDDRLIRKLLLDARIATLPPQVVMQKLESFVRAHIRERNLRTGYASAATVARTRAGDCTEHAVLLAALGRAASIPTRIAAGYVYDGSDTKAPRFVPHAWTQALIEGQWRSFDAAQNGFGSGHLMLASSNGDPSSIGWVLAGAQLPKLVKIERAP